MPASRNTPSFRKHALPAKSNDETLTHGAVIPTPKSLPAATETSYNQPVKHRAARQPDFLSEIDMDRVKKLVEKNKILYTRLASESGMTVHEWHDNINKDCDEDPIARKKKMDVLESWRATVYKYSEGEVPEKTVWDAKTVESLSPVFLTEKVKAAQREIGYYLTPATLKGWFLVHIGHILRRKGEDSVSLMTTRGLYASLLSHLNSLIDGLELDQARANDPYSLSPAQLAEIKGGLADVEWKRADAAKTAEMAKTEISGKPLNSFRDTNPPDDRFRYLAKARSGIYGLLHGVIFRVKESEEDPGQPTSIAYLDEEFERQYALNEWKFLGSIFKQQVDPEGLFCADLLARKSD